MRFATLCPHYPARWLFPVHPTRGHGGVTPCRLCFEAAHPQCPPFPRHAVRQMVCAFCACAQPCAAACANPDCTAHGQAHGYYCGVCHLWLRPATDIYHCDKCGICRVGRASDYEHCDSCGMCVPSGPRALEHRCWGQLGDATCPVCYMPCDATGRDAISFLPCGHALHAECLQQMLAHGHFACPLCRK